MVRILKIGGVVLAALIVTVLAGDALYYWATAPAVPDTAPLIAKAEHYHVRIKRDGFGVPHVFGKTDADTAFGFAVAHAEDDFDTIQDVTLATRGTLSAADGLDHAVTDYLVHLLRVWEAIDARYERDLPADVRRVLDAYADGINFYAALHPEKIKRGLLPVTGRDIAAGFVFKTPFFYGLDRTLKNVNSPPADDGKPPVGSNGAAVGPARSGDGETMLLVNSHQPYSGPVAWYEAVLESGEGWHVAGGFFPGSPFMLHGHNAHLGWANTVNNPDLADVYRLTLNPDDEDQYRLDGKWVDFEKRDAAITVRLWGPFYWTVHREVLRSLHGPVLKTDHGAFAIRYAGMGEVRQVLQYYRLDKARNSHEWLAAMRLQALPSINYVYADEKGNIGYVYNGQFPNRKSGMDWSGTLPGDRTDLIWHGYLPFDRVPQVWNPANGFVFNSNNTPFEATAPNGNLDPKDFAPEMGIQTNMTNRAYRALETFGADPIISPEEFRRYKFDLTYSTRSEIADEIRDVLKANPGGDADLKEALHILKSWDRRTNRDNRGTALAVAMGMNVAPQEQGGPRKMAPIEGLRKAISQLKTHFGRLDPPWGSVNRIRHGGVDLPIDGAPDIYRAVYGAPQDDGTLTAVGGDTLIMFVRWDRTGKLSSESIHQFGSATMDRESPHYADQTPLFAAMKTKPVLFTAGELAGHVSRDYTPGDLAAAH